MPISNKVGSTENETMADGEMERKMGSIPTLSPRSYSSMDLVPKTSVRRLPVFETTPYMTSCSFTLLGGRLLKGNCHSFCMSSSIPVLLNPPPPHPTLRKMRGVAWQLCSSLALDIHLRIWSPGTLKSDIWAWRIHKNLKPCFFF